MSIHADTDTQTGQPGRRQLARPQVKWGVFGAQTPHWLCPEGQLFGSWCRRGRSGVAWGP